MHWLYVWAGLSNTSGAQYLRWSGIVGDFGLVGVCWTLIRRHNCHQSWCWRVGRYKVADSNIITCKRHHPDPVIRNGIKAHHILHLHQGH